MQTYLLLGTISTESTALSSTFTDNRMFSSPRLICCKPWSLRNNSYRSGPVTASAETNNEQDHYAVLGISSASSSADVKKAYRLLARKYHPDVSKNSQAGEIFKSIRLAYDVLSNELSRAKYDHTLKFHKDYETSWRRNWNATETTKKRRNWAYDSELEEVIKRNRWAKLRWQMLREKYWQEYMGAQESSNSSDDEAEGTYEKENSEDKRGSFSEVLSFAFFTLFFTQTLGSRISLMLCSFSALLDEKLDAGYKVGYLIAWALGGRGGVLLTLCLSFASWLFGKTSSSLVAVVVVAMWVGTNLSRYLPLAMSRRTRNPCLTICSRIKTHLSNKTTNPEIYLTKKTMTNIDVNFKTKARTPTFPDLNSSCVCFLCVVWIESWEDQAVFQAK